MRPFDFVVPESVDEACRTLAERGGEAAPIAGGQTLLLQMKSREVGPKVLIDIRRLAPLRGRELKNADLRLGPCTTYAELEDATDLQGSQEMLAAVAGGLADRAVRNLATLGGAACAGEPNFDVPVALVALDARLRLRSTGGARELKASEFFTGAAQTARRADELLEAVLVPASNGGSHWAFAKFRQRLPDPALASVAAVIAHEEGGTVRQARLVAGSVQEVPLRLGAAEQRLVGGVLDEAAIREAGSAAADAITEAHAGAGASLAYLKELVASLTQRALRQAAGSAGQNREAP